MITKHIEEKKIHSQYFLNNQSSEKRLDGHQLKIRENKLKIRRKNPLAFHWIFGWKIFTVYSVYLSAFVKLINNKISAGLKMLKTNVFISPQSTKPSLSVLNNCNK